MAVDIFLMLEGIKGEALDNSHKDEIDILSFSWGASQSGTTHIGGGSGSGKVHVHDISFTKYIDKSSATLLQHCAVGKHIPKAKLVVRKAGEKPLEYFTIDFEKLIVTNLTFGGHGSHDRLTESVSLNFSTYHVKYAVQNKDGSKGAQTEHKFLIPENTSG